ncbi:type II toxin-antitoxin system VapC family toxin [Jannaschia sp. LMIT008]|uniref:type II toxin-antitoxin system VapC family toxin n=1 Tax=Jannaschia maritima TaxID=3032585 RepID=UPI002810CFF9|nr:type II toxin-antitoxin system VapC family toxin [Jannaschia sp. LMIT008]
MILVDTSVWIDHIRSPVPLLTDRLAANRIACHPFVVTELALGSIANRTAVLRELSKLVRTRFVSVTEVQEFIERHPLHNRGIGTVDATLLLSCVVTEGARLWTRDKRLHALALELDCAMIGPN